MPAPRDIAGTTDAPLNGPLSNQPSSKSPLNVGSANCWPRTPTLLTMLKLRDDWQGREMAWHLHWLLLKAETREPRRSLFKFCFCPSPRRPGRGVALLHLASASTSAPTKAPMVRIIARMPAISRWLKAWTAMPAPISSAAISAWRSEKVRTRSGSSARIFGISAEVKAETRGFSRRTCGGRTA